jgi:hypothetical protein
MRIAPSILTLALVAVPCFGSDLENAWHVIRPIIHAKDEQKAAAMRSASLVVLAEIQAVEVFDKPRGVEKPPEVGGPMIPVIPLQLARISAEPLLTLDGIANERVEFYSWVWASGKHGGPRLFNPTPGSVHVLFLMRESGYLHTVGDYPAYDIEVRLQFVKNFIANWEAGVLRGADLLERTASVRLKAEFETLDETEAANYWLNAWELVTLTSREFVATQLSGLCTSLTNPGGRARACSEHAQLVQQ